MYFETNTAESSPCSLGTWKGNEEEVLTCTKEMMEKWGEREDTSPGEEDEVEIVMRTKKCWEKGTKTQYEAAI